MEAELKEKIRNLKYDEKIEFDYKNITAIVQNFKYDLIVGTKPNFIFKVLALLILMFVFAFVGVLLYGAGVKAGGLVMILILFLYKPFATEISKIFYYNKLKELKQELTDVKYGEVETNLNYSTQEDTERNIAIEFTNFKSQEKIMDVKDDTSNKSLKNKDKTIKYIFEFIFTALLCFVLIEVRNKVAEYDDGDLVCYSFCLIMFIMLFMEWIRRRQVTEKRPYYENYIYVLLMFMVLFIGIYMIKTFYTETPNVY